MLKTDKALLQQNLLANLPRPDLKDLELLIEWMKRPTMGNVYLLGRDSDCWAQENSPDLVALQARGDDDLLSS
jgi:hypothetical protein